MNRVIRLASKSELSLAFSPGDSRLAQVLAREIAFRSITCASVSAKVQTVTRLALKIGLSPKFWRCDSRLVQVLARRTALRSLTCAAGFEKVQGSYAWLRKLSSSLRFGVATPVSLRFWLENRRFAR